jgi:hypothetical protein
MTGFHVGFTLLATAVGAFFLLVGGLMLRTHRDRSRRGVVTVGTVVGSRWAASGAAPGEPSLHARPVVEFTDETGELRTFVHAAGTNLRPKEGREVQVWHDPGRPEDQPVIHGDGVMMLGPVLLMGVGVLILTVTALAVAMIVGQG